MSRFEQLLFFLAEVVVFFRFEYHSRARSKPLPWNLAWIELCGRDLLERARTVDIPA